MKICFDSSIAKLKINIIFFPIRFSVKKFCGKCFLRNFVVKGFKANLILNECGHFQISVHLNEHIIIVMKTDWFSVLKKILEK